VIDALNNGFRGHTKIDANDGSDGFIGSVRDGAKRRNCKEWQES
jgi:hypothetical protein